MKRIMVVIGSRADAGMLIWPIRVLREDGAFDVQEVSIRDCSPTGAFAHIEHHIRVKRPDMMMVLGDRFEILAAVMKAHLERVPIVHICGGDVTEGSYDDAMRDAISRMASIHFVASTAAMARLTHAGYHNVHLVGSPGIDYIKHASWKRERPYSDPYVVVSYQAETIDGTNEIRKLLDSLDLAKRTVFILPNKDMLSGEIADCIATFAFVNKKCVVHQELPHGEFLNLIAHCEEFIGNSSAMLYEAPELGIKTRMIGKRQRGRTIPWGDGCASERIAKVLKYASF